MLKRLLLPTVLVLIAVFAAPATSGAVTIGSNLVSPPGKAAMPATSGVDNCSNSHQCTVMQIDLPAGHAAPGGLVAPTAGIITHFRVKVKTSMAPIELRVLRPASGAGNFTGISTSAMFLPPVGDPGVGTISPSYEVRMPIAAGDSIGLNCCESTTNGIYNLDTGAGQVRLWGTTTHPLLADGATAVNDNSHTDHELLVQADIEADADGDGYGDETQDLCPGNAAVHTACPVAVKKAAKCKKKKAKKRAAVSAKKMKCAKRKHHK